MFFLAVVIDFLVSTYIFAEFENFTGLFCFAFYDISPSNLQGFINFRMLLMLEVMNYTISNFQFFRLSTIAIIGSNQSIFLKNGFGLRFSQKQGAFRLGLWLHT